ncbi:MoaD/ThiS family protein [Thermodesulfobacteriota bacterium B35]
MRLTVRLFAFFRDGRFRERECDYPEGTTVREIITSLGIDPGEVGVIMLNSRHCSQDQVVHQGDKLAIFPVIGGG